MPPKAAETPEAAETAVEEKRLLAYFIEEARSNYRRNRRFGGVRQEDLYARIFQDIEGKP